MDEQYCLKWGSHTEAITDIAYKFLEHESLVDVTLVCQEFNQTHFFKAHQIILSACSPYFESLFLNNTHPHPIVFLTDIKKKELETILMFMYRGEVNVEHDRIKSILNTAKSLMVRGLCDNVCETDRDPSSQSQEMKRSQNTEHFSPKRRKYEENGRMSENFDEEYEDDYEAKYPRCGSPSACYDSPVIRKIEAIDCTDRINSSKDDPMDYSMETFCRNESVNRYHNNSRVYEDDKSNPHRSYSASPDTEYSAQKSNNYSSNEHINAENEKVIIRRVNSSLSVNCRNSSSQEISVIQANSSNSENTVQIPYTNVIPPQFIGPKRVGHFQSKWMELFSWLQYDKESKKMYCKFCRKWGDIIPNIRRTSFVDGSCNFRFEIVKHHDCSKSHQICVHKDETNETEYKF
ncbi:uncharacterized protein LOC135849242 [Planococcus citri]|uniref:uncharacterized protein LOC135849242 n=1 Tax=Planococcus citri TaxID=170843 RepID=UPI0031F92AC7